ncbi:hypothetical protein RJ639_024880 [Escallonia herrerae]|uniref:Uncharacterized protein n=1 Tax=Escallonia herrerae TaxID=1293975 RepID=A0AA88UW87_9ASTE|nr:hypothetical protein RJ639_024880 [Escallonia herrerae]
MHLPFKTSSIELTMWSIFMRVFNPSSNLARRPRMPREVPAKSSPSVLCTTPIRTWMAPDLTTTIKEAANLLVSGEVEIKLVMMSIISMAISRSSNNFKLYMIKSKERHSTKSP